MGTRQRTGGGHRIPWLPGWMVALLSFTFLLTVTSFSSMAVAAPAVLRGTDLTHLRQALLVITLVTYGGTFLAALIAGVAAGRRGLRRGASTMTNLVGSLFGTLLVPGGLIGYALLARLPVPTRPTEVNLALIGAGSMVGCLLAVAIWGRKRPGATPPPPVVPPKEVLVAALLTIVCPATSITPPARPEVFEARPVANVSTRNPLDFEQQACRWQSLEQASSADLTLYSIDLGTSFAYREERFADGHWEAKVTSGLQSGLKLVLGDHIAAGLLNGTQASSGLSLALAADGLLTRVNVYDLQDAKDAANTVKWQLNGYLDDTVVLPSLSKLLRGSVTPQSIDAGFRSQVPKETDVELAGNLRLTASAGVLVAYSFDIAVGTAAGVRFKHEDKPGAAPNDTNREPVSNPTSVEIIVKLDGQIDANVTSLLNAVSPGAKGSLTLVMAIAPSQALQTVWLPTQISIEAEGEMMRGAALDLSKEQLDHLGALAGPSAGKEAKSIAKNLGLSSKSSSAGRLEMEESLPFDEHPADLPIFMDFFSSLQAALSRRVTEAERVRLETTARSLASAMDRDASWRLRGYGVKEGGASFDVQIGELVGFAASRERTVTEEQLVGAGYRDGNRHWIESQSCRAAPQLGT